MPTEFGRYQLQDLLGRGGMGEVYRAFDTERQRTVALKLLATELGHDELFKARFRRESLLAARLNEPHIIPIHDFGEINGRLFLDMRLVEGHDLGSIIASHGPMPASIAVDVISQIALALDAAHSSGLVHRDVKPSNILITGDINHPFAYLVDFGIVRSIGSGGTAALTATSTTLGTFAYMAPERLMGEPGDQRVDIYALACVLHECLTGRRPFDGELPALMYAHVNLAPPPASALATGIPPALDAVIANGMAKNPDQRYGRAPEFAAAARAALTGVSGARPPVAPASPVVPPTNSLMPPTVIGALPPAPPSPPSRHRPWPWIAAAAVLAVAIAAVAIVLATRGGSPKAGPTPTNSTGAPTTPASSSSNSIVSVAACEKAHGLSQATTTTAGHNRVTFTSCSAPPGPGADSDGYLVITAYSLATDLPESSGESDFDFVVGPCSTFKLTYSFAKQGTTQILDPFTIKQGEVLLVGSENTPFSLATAGADLSVIPNPGTGQAVYIHNGSYAINQASCVSGGTTPAPVPSDLLASAAATP